MGISVEAIKKMSTTIYERIKQELKAQKIPLKDVAKRLGYKNSSGLSMALKRGSLRLNDFMEIAFMLNMRPMELFPDEVKADIYNMTLIEVIENVCHMTLVKHLEESHKLDEDIINHIENEKKTGGGGGKWSS